RQRDANHAIGLERLAEPRHRGGQARVGHAERHRRRVVVAALVDGDDLEQVLTRREQWRRPRAAAGIEALVDGQGVDEAAHLVDRDVWRARLDLERRQARLAIPREARDLWWCRAWREDERHLHRLVEGALVVGQPGADADRPPT